MLGPGVIVALRAPLSAMNIDAFGDWLHRIGTVSRVVRDPDSGWPWISNWDLRITDPAAIGMNLIATEDRATICDVSVGVGATRDASGMLYEDDEDDVAQWIAQVGFFPDQYIALSAECNSPITHRILGYMALILAERYNGIIDLNGAWYPIKVGKFVYEGPGNAYEIHYMTAQETSWYYHLADIEAFRFSLQQEHFYLNS